MRLASDSQYGLVFTSRTGNPLRRNTAGDMWHRARELAGLPAWATFHDLRHFYASLLIDRGCSVKAVQRRLGHQSAMETSTPTAISGPTATTRPATPPAEGRVWARARPVTCRQTSCAPRRSIGRCPGYRSVALMATTAALRSHREDAGLIDRLRYPVLMAP
jgi:hypothetical protein